jgi:glycosyltransferase involved in cell wall biosynthesis
MTVVAVSMVRNEEDVIGHVVRHMLAECDRVIVADNRSTDGTLAELANIETGDLTVVDEPRFAFCQTDTMNRLAAMAPDADWIVPFDADEWWDSAEGRIADVLMGLDADATMTRTWDMVPQPDDPDDPNPFSRITRYRPGSLWAQPRHGKVAFRPGPGRHIQQGNHGLAGEVQPPVGPLRLRHIPFRSFEQAKAKVRHGRDVLLAAGMPPSGWPRAVGRPRSAMTTKRGG